MAGFVIQPPGWPAPKGYSNGILTSAGELLTVAGQVGWDANGRFVSDDFARQFEQALKNVLAVVKAAGGKPENVVSMRLYVVDKREYRSRQRELAAVWREHFGKYYPAMSLVQVVALLEDAAKVEIEALAVLPPRTSETIADGDDDHTAATSAVPIEQDFDPPTKTIEAVGDDDFDPPTATLPAVEKPKDDDDE